DSAGARASASSAAPAPPPVADQRLDGPTDAADFSRRALASAARHDFASAIADLDHACDLAPGVAAYHYQRGFLHWQNKEPDRALADFDKAIDVNPDEVDSHVMRASIRLWRHDSAGAAEDLASADRAAPKDSDARPSIARVYQSLGNIPAAREQLSMWIDTHPRDARMPEMLNSRCWYGGLTGQGLEQARADCNAALKLQPKAAAFLDSRGLVYVRLGNYDKAIKDYDAALKINPKIVWSLYGRGLAELRMGRTAAGQADLAAANALQPKIAERAAKFGLAP
ncbi:MAG: tetratricopeptide repeat protein, partial [Mycobacteriales bacterium]